MLDLQGAYDQLVKVRANLTKQAKTLSADKSKTDTLKQVDLLLPAIQKVLVAKKGLDKRLEEVKKLGTDIGNYNAVLDKVTADARNLTKATGNLVKSDTPTRDFFMMTNLLQRVGQEMHMEEP